MLEKLKTEKAIRLDFLAQKNLAEKAPSGLLMATSIVKAANITFGGLGIILLIASLIFKYQTSRVQSQVVSVPGLPRAYEAVSAIANLKERLELSEAAGQRKSLLANQFSELSHAIPWGAWINSLSISQRQMSLSGGALSQELLIKMIKALENLSWVKRVSLQQSNLQPLPPSPGVSAPPGSQPSMHAVFDILCELSP